MTSNLLSPPWKAGRVGGLPFDASTAPPASPYMSKPAPDCVTTGAGVDSPATLAADVDSAATLAAGWDRIIDTLIDWGRDPDQLADDGVDAPTRLVISTACEVARILRDRGSASPDSVVSDPNGGIVFERRSGASKAVLHIDEECGIELRRFEGSKLRVRLRLV